MRIGDLSHRTGCNIETIRYYERVGLLPRPPRSPSRYRLYDMDDVRRLTFVRRSRELGFSLDEVRTLLALSADSGREPAPKSAILPHIILRIFGRRSHISERWSAFLPTLCEPAMLAKASVAP